MCKLSKTIYLKQVFKNVLPVLGEQKLFQTHVPTRVLAHTHAYAHIYIHRFSLLAQPSC